MTVNQSFARKDGHNQLNGESIMKLNIGICMVLLLNNQITHAVLLADYVFENNLSGNIGGAPAIEFLGSTTNYEVGMIQGWPVTALQIGLDTGLKLDLTQWSICDEYSIVLHGYIDDVLGYKKLIDFRNIFSDAGLYNLDGAMNYVIGQAAAGTSLVQGEYFQMAFTRDNNDLVNVYVNGELELSFTDNSFGTDMCSSDFFHFFVDDLATNVESPSGAIARVTIYDHALTEDEVGELEILDIIFANDYEMIEQP